MAILELPPNPSRMNKPTHETDDPSAEQQSSGAAPSPRPLKPLRTDRPQPAVTTVKVRTGRYGEMEEHELIHLLDALDDERAKAQFRESVYISTILCLAVAWFLFYGPRFIWHQPQFQDPIALMKQHDKEMTMLIPPTAPRLKAPPKLDQKTITQLQKEARQARPAPSAPQPPAPEAPQEQAHTTPPPPAPVQPTPAPPAPRAAIPSAPTPSLPSAPSPRIAQNNETAGDAIRNAMRGGRSSGADIGAPSQSGPLQAGAQILSDTQGVDFSAYMRRLHNDIQRNWDPLIPEEVEPPLLKKGIVGIRFIILPGGQIGDIKLETQSGDVALDKAAWYAITSEGQFPPLPKEFHGPNLELRVGFFYNEPIR
jgi:outer membrane biosynthesis protein TonB